MSRETSEDSFRMSKGVRAATADQGPGGGGPESREQRREEAGPMQCWRIICSAGGDSVVCVPGSQAAL